MVIDQPACGDENWDQWVPLSDVLATVAGSEADVNAGRTFGEDEIRAAYRVPRQPS
jgi:antitoxin YefM